MFEPGTIETWLYTTLKGDATLASLLAVDNQPPNYQQGIYNTIVPEVDPISRRTPRMPYIVFSMASSGADETPLCGSRIFSYPVYRVTVWNTSSGAASMTDIQAIMDRVETLVDNVKVTTTTPDFYIRRQSPAETFSLVSGGHIDFGVTGLYRVVTQS